MIIFDFLNSFSMAKRKKTSGMKGKYSQGIYGINANKSRINPVRSRSDIKTKVTSIKVK